MLVHHWLQWCHRFGQNLLVQDLLGHMVCHLVCNRLGCMDSRMVSLLAHTKSHLAKHLCSLLGFSGCCWWHLLGSSLGWCFGAALLGDFGLGTVESQWQLDWVPQWELPPGEKGLWALPVEVDSPLLLGLWALPGTKT